MKNIFLLLVALAFTDSEAYSQILNGGFEDWTDGKPDHWFVKYSDEASQNQEGHSGVSSLHYLSIKEHQFDGFLTNNSKIPFGKFNLVFWYRASFYHDTIGSFNVTVSITHNGKYNGEIEGTSCYYSSSWRKITLSDFPLIHLDSNSEDSIVIIFGESTSGPVSLDLDDVILEPIVNSTNLSQKNNNISFSIFPNPILSHANINYQINANSAINSSIFDLTGCEVLKLPTVQSAYGDGSTPFDCDGLPNGMYYLQFEAGGEILMRKIIVQH